MILHGKELKIYGSGASTPLVAMAKSCDISVTSDSIETASPDTGVWRTYIAGRREWSVSVSYLVMAGQVANDILRVGDVVTLVIKEDTSGSTTLTGTAIVQDCQITATKGNLSQGSFKFQGSGALQ